MTTRQIRLNPCDYLYFVHHRHIRRTRTGGAVGFLVLECTGHAPPGQVQAALAEALAAHPSALAQARVGMVLGRPFWQLPDPSRLTQLACRAAQDCYVHDDLRDAPDADRALHDLLELRFQPDWDLSSGQLVRLEQYTLPEDRTCFCLRFPHALMDAGGGQWFLAELGRYSPPSAAETGEHVNRDDSREPAPRPLPDGLAPDGETLQPLRGVSMLERVRLFLRGFKLGAEFRHLRFTPLAQRPAPPVQSQGIIRRTWPATMVRQMRANADRFAPPGPASHARYLAACVIRALHVLYTERGLSADAYPVSLPLSLLDDDEAKSSAVAAGESAGESSDPPERAGPRHRPIPGNYLVAPTLYGRREIVGDRAALGQDLLAQLQHYLAQRGDLAQWTMIYFASWLRVGMYDYVFKKGIGQGALASGFSYYGQIPRPVRRIGGAKVINLWGTAPLGTPPGLNPIFNKYQGKLNLGLAFNRPAISDELARHFVDLIEQEIFSETESRP